MLVEAIKVGDGESGSLGRWRLNSGSEMILTVPALGKKPVRVVMDFATAKFSGDKVVALYGHEEEKVVGFWNRGNISSRGVEADFHVIEPINAMEANVLPEAVVVKAIARSGVPIQLSVGAAPGKGGSYELVTGKVQCNGREYDGGGDIPLYILRSGEIFEGSFVTFGADSETGRIAAHRHTPVKKKETPMSDKLKALLGKYPEKYHGLVARCVAEDHDEATISNKIAAADMAEVTKELETLRASNITLQAELAAEKAKVAAVQAAKDAQQKIDDAAKEATSQEVKAKAAGSKEGVMFASKGDKENKGEPKTLTEAMNAEIEAGSKEKGFALRAACLKKYPNIERK